MFKWSNGDRNSQLAGKRTGQLDQREKGDKKVPDCSDKDRTVKSA